ACASYDDKTRLAVCRAEESNVSVRHNLTRVYAKPRQSLLHTLAQISAPDSGESNLRRDYVCALNVSFGAGVIHRFTNCRSGCGDAYAHRVRRSGGAFAQHARALVHDDGVRLRAPAVNPKHKLASMNSMGRHKILYLTVHIHYLFETPLHSKNNCCHKSRPRLYSVLSHNRN